MAAMPLKSKPYWYAECDNCGERAECYDGITAWEQKDAAADEAIAADWTEQDGRFHCPTCPALDVGEDCTVEAVFSDGCVPCILPRGRAEPHSYGDTVIPFADETGG